MLLEFGQSVGNTGDIFFDNGDVGFNVSELYIKRDPAADDRGEEPQNPKTHVLEDVNATLKPANILAWYAHHRPKLHPEPSSVFQQGYGPQSTVGADTDNCATSPGHCSKFLDGLTQDPCPSSSEG
ncbi:MAG TPA: hypothetical protein VFL53_16515, partial [Pseudolabrys sp.]|nr:hypothetical protein [Pseudolabrys sp.]